MDVVVMGFGYRLYPSYGPYRKLCVAALACIKLGCVACRKRLWCRKAVLIVSGRVRIAYHNKAFRVKASLKKVRDAYPT